MLVPRYDVGRLSPRQLINAARNGDPEVEPVPPKVLLIRPRSLPRAVFWANGLEDRELAELAARKALRRATPALVLLNEQRWLQLPGCARCWVVRVTQDRPEGMASLLRELKQEQMSLALFYNTYVGPMRDAG